MLETAGTRESPSQLRVGSFAMRRLPAERIGKLPLFLYVLLVASPIRYWALSNDGDNTWVFAMNHAAAQGLAFGRDLVWTTGPLGYLTFPMDTGNNLVLGLWFQAMVWVTLLGVFADLFFWAKYSLRTLTIFTILFGLSASLYWFNRMGVENLLLAGAAILLVNYRLEGKTIRYAGALLLLGLVPLIKVTAAVIAAGLLMGYLVDSIWRYRKLPLSEISLAIVLPAAVVGVGSWLTIPSIDAFGRFLRASSELASGYSVAMSRSGRITDIAAAFGIMLTLGSLVALLGSYDRRGARFFSMLLFIPFAVSFKHGFVRQDDHVANFFCFAMLAMALIALAIDWSQSRIYYGVAFLLVCISTVPAYSALHSATLIEMTGYREATTVRNAVLGLPWLRGKLQTWSETQLPGSAHVEPEIRAILGDEPVAFLSVGYSEASADHLNIRLYPVVQRYAAFTPYLDGLNADWIREQGPRFLVFDGAAIDGRDPWAETPAMWIEVYRWYDTRLLGARNLLLQRRARPRFAKLTSVNRFQIAAAELKAPRGLRLPASTQPIFWSMVCTLNEKGRILKSLFRVPEVEMGTTGVPDDSEPARVIMDVLVSPVMGTYLPSTLQDYAELFGPNLPSYSIRKVTFGGAGLEFYSSVCQVELWREE